MNRHLLRFQLIRVFAITVSTYTFAISSIAQSDTSIPGHITICPLGQRPVPAGLTIRSVKIMARRGVAPIEKKLQDTLVGKRYTSDLHDLAMEEVENTLTNEANKAFEKYIGIAGGATPTISGVAAIRTVPCVDIDTIAQTVDVIVKVLFLRVDLRNLSNNLLSLPRSLKPSFYDQMPGFLRAFNPKVDFAYDFITGPVPSLTLSTNLIELPALLQAKETSDSDLLLNFNFIGEKSLTHRFYRIRTDLELSKISASHFVEQMDIIAGFRKDDQPLTDRRHINDGLKLGAQIKLRPRLVLLSSVYLSGTYSRLDHQLYDRSQRQILGEKDNRGTYRSLFDGRVYNGFARLGLWFESAKGNISTNYRKLAGIVGYQIELGRGTQTLGVQVTGGAGKAWGTLPLHTQFFGGNNASNFLYESQNAVTMTEFPIGPLLRSYGKRQAGVRSQTGIGVGGRSYWHTNLNLTIPIRRWSRPLIPDEIVPFETGNVKLNDLLENFTIKTAIGSISGDLLDPIIEELKRQDPTLDEDTAVQKALPIALERANKIVNKDIAPAIRFIARRANLFAIKPLLMFDAVWIGGTDGENGRHRFAAGGGLQCVIVVARAEIGYMTPLPKISGESKGSFVLRLTFQNLF